MLKITEIKIDDIHLYEKNQKKHPEEQIRNIAKSIEKYGFVQPVVLDKNNEVIIGHGRILAAKELGTEKIPCVYADSLTEEQVKELRILDNKLNESEWDFEMLKQELEELDLSEFDIDFNIPEDIEFNEDVLNNLFEDAEPKDKEPKMIQCPHCGEMFEA